MKLLDLDGNKLKTVEGLQLSYQLESLSLRGQRAISEVVSNILSTPSECRSIYLSSNLAPGGCFELPPLPQHNLRELALSGCGLSELPLGFGHFFPNCQKLNLAFNGISDIGTLRGMQNLAVLCIARNRIKRLRRTCLVLSRLETLSTLDVRDNPVSLGFYRPQHNASTHDASGLEMYYHLLKRSVEKDQAWWGLLDETTKLKRRMIELLLAEKCPNLQQLDGAAFGREAEMKTDQTWDTLTQKGVLVKSEPGMAQELETNAVRGKDSSLHGEERADMESYDEERSVMVE
jgi:protein NUD1